jgi:hypothetical protein
MSTQHRFYHQPDPNPIQIAALARQIRSKWTDKERRARHATAIGFNEKYVRFPQILERATGLHDSSDEL